MILCDLVYVHCPGCASFSLSSFTSRSTGRAELLSMGKHPPCDAFKAVYLGYGRKFANKIMRTIRGYHLIKPEELIWRPSNLMKILKAASGGYPWTIVRTARRKQYLDALEVDSADQNIIPFARFICEEMSVDWSHELPRK